MKKDEKINFYQINVTVKEKVVLLRPQNKSISINHLKEGSVFKMIIVPVKEGESIDRALKRYKRKYEKTGVVKDSVIKRAQLMKAIYVQKLREAEENM